MPGPSGGPGGHNNTRGGMRRYCRRRERRRQQACLHPYLQRPRAEDLLVGRLRVAADVELAVRVAAVVGVKEAAPRAEAARRVRDLRVEPEERVLTRPVRPRRREVKERDGRRVGATPVRRDRHSDGRVGVRRDVQRPVPRGVERGGGVGAVEEVSAVEPAGDGRPRPLGRRGRPALYAFKAVRRGWRVRASRTIRRDGIGDHSNRVNKKGSIRRYNRRDVVVVVRQSTAD